MRIVLINWLVDVHYKMELIPETLFLTVNIIDRYLSKVNIHRNKLQLIGIVALMIACKFEEMLSPETSDFSKITDNTFSVKRIIDMEK